eukprot:Skav235540  [mRNA]  locus=scaffold3067:174996:182179:+ [translate_table: standard]
MSASDVGSGGAICALSGLPLEAEGSREGGWLYREVQGSAMPSANLALRRMGIKAQAAGMHSLLAGTKEADGSAPEHGQPQFLRDLEKPDAEIEAAATQMSFEQICKQNQRLSHGCAMLPLCQIIEGPFQKRLLTVGARRATVASARPRSLAPGEQSWATLVQLICSRITSSLQP